MMRAAEYKIYGWQGAVTKALEDWARGTTVVVNEVRLPVELVTAHKDDLKLILAIFHALKRASKVARQDPDPDAGPLELPRVKKR